MLTKRKRATIRALDRAIVGLITTRRERLGSTVYSLRGIRESLVFGEWPNGKFAWRRARNAKTKTLILARLRSLAKRNLIRRMVTPTGEFFR